MKNLTLLLFTLLFSNVLCAQSKTPLLEKTISIKLNNIKTDAALNLIGEKGGFTFSYNPLIIDINRTVNFNFSNKTIREILQQLFNGKIEGKVKGNHIILSKSKIPAPQSKKNEVFKVSGYIESSNGNKIPWASIYNKSSMSSTVTDEYGFYSIELPKELVDLSLYISKKEYEDTLIMLTDNSIRFLNVTLQKVNADTTSANNTEQLFKDAESTWHSFFMKPEDYANQENIKDTIYRKSQVSVIPFVGTNGRLSGNTINDYSLNIFGGYSLGNRKLELGGFFNVNKGDVGKCQIAGFVNAAGGNVKGFQAAGFVNAVNGNTENCQIAGFVNANGGDVKGFQAAGFVNAVNGNFNGCQMAGFVNAVNGNAGKCQMAGFVNANRRKFDGLQMAGFVNTNLDTATGVQIAGFVNYVHRKFTGTQVAGFVNVTIGEMKGSQIGTVNYADRITGAQVGFFNYTNSCTGIPVGFISFVKDGYHKIEISADELFYTNLAFRTGVNEFHNILTAGIRPSSNSLLWNFGYGVGSSIPLGKKVNLDIDITGSQIVEDDNIDKMNLLTKGYIGADVKLTKKMSLAFGGTVNAQITDADYVLYPDIFTNMKPHVFYTSSLDGERLNMKMWIGGKIGLRFL